MKRSEINNYIKEAEEIFQDNRFLLPPWAAWTVEDWKQNKTSCQNIFESQLGWDLTDFGSRNYLTTGLLLITIRNGNNSFDKKPYGEKIMIVKENQETPFHFHWSKTEDIIKARSESKFRPLLDVISWALILFIISIGWTVIGTLCFIESILVYAKISNYKKDLEAV